MFATVVSRVCLCGREAQPRRTLRGYGKNICETVVGAQGPYLDGIGSDIACLLSVFSYRIEQVFVVFVQGTGSMILYSVFGASGLSLEATTRPQFGPILYPVVFYWVIYLSPDLRMRGLEGNKERNKKERRRMVRGKTQMKKIEDPISRQVTFSKRRNGLLKKACELSVLCDAQVGLIVFSQRGKVYEFSSHSMQKMLERYEKCSEEGDTGNTNKEHDKQHLKGEMENMEKRIKILESTQRKMLGEELASCALKDLNQLESQVERGLSHIRARKIEILVARIEQLKRKEQILSEENALLRKKCVDPPNVNGSCLTTHASEFGSIQNNEVETQLVMRPPNIKEHFLVHRHL